LDPAPEPTRYLVALLPALGAACFAAASVALGALSGARRAALRDSLEGRKRRALDRYIEQGPAIESRWLVLRVLGIALSALLVGRELPASLDGWLPVVAALFALVAYGVPAEIARALVARAPERAAPLLLRLLRPFELLVAPIAAPMTWIGNWVGRLVTGPARPAPNVTETEVEIIVTEGELNGSLDHEQSEMIRNVLDFGDVTAGELMVPRTSVTAFEVETPTAELLRLVAANGHSRYPVYRDRIDNVVGILHVKDLITHVASGDLNQLRFEDILRKSVAYVPESQSASSVLKDMRAGRHHMAIVLDEFGGMSGIVTLEDLIEEIVGDIQDEHDVEEPPIEDLGNGRLMVDATVPIADLSRYLGAELPDDGDYNSLGGLIVARLGRVPRPGARLSACGLDFFVREADERRVMKVEIVRKAPAPKRESSRMSAA
jgi:magnesium and cobalt exporter, CNNM family